MIVYSNSPLKLSLPFNFLKHQGFETLDDSTVVKGVIKGVPKTGCLAFAVADISRKSKPGIKLALGCVTPRHLFCTISHEQRFHDHCSDFFKIKAFCSSPRPLGKEGACLGIRGLDAKRQRATSPSSFVS